LARQKLGQHFLIRESILNRIAAAVCPDAVDLVVEIGPGRGALTRKLLERARRVVAVELDPYLAGHLRAAYAAELQLEIVEGDILETDLARWPGAPIAGNLPYYITSAIIERVLDARPPRAVFLVQKEVALRLAAQPGTRDYGYLTVRTAFSARVTRLFDVKPGAFHPPPKVDSSVVLLEPHAPPDGIADPEAFIRFASRCFAHKRKTLRNNLAETYGKAALDACPEAGMRAEQLSLAQFVDLYTRLSSGAGFQPAPLERRV
jgi:16S rRNA (adenine1518-N6/adenine1519-N6)-dimethyltransferase